MNAHTLTVNNINIRYNIEGRGPDVVFIHGWVASRRMWAHITAGLTGAYRCWAIDLPGCGDSDKPTDGWYTIPNYTASLRGFMRLAGLQRVRLVSHSMGGLIGLDFAAQYPDLVERLVVINPVVSGRVTLRPVAREWWGRPLLDLTLRLSPLVLQPVLNQPLWNGIVGVNYLRRRTQDFSKGTVASIVGSGKAAVAYSVAPRLPSITAPTLVLLGSLDMVVPGREGRLAAARIPGAQLEVLRAGHLVTDDQPAATTQLLRRFLA